MYTVLRWWGEESADLPEDEFAEVIAQLEAADDEHADVSLTHESEWCLTYGKSGTLIYQNVTRGAAPPRHMKNLTADDVRSFWAHLAAGDLEWLERQGWSPGYGNRT